MMIPAIPFDGETYYTLGGWKSHRLINFPNAVSASWLIDTPKALCNVSKRAVGTEEV